MEFVEVIWQVCLAIAAIVFFCTALERWDKFKKDKDPINVVLAIVVTWATALVWYFCYLCMVKVGIL